ncbi:TetR/AcrR family transcriptional regulator [Secundilactobacillus silagei]|uniref:AcrR family transcriptional regulator n=1 Tax=Secundilactobacillus silagei JCM 19001 TaxID=1302250 RepID=A0A1Z5IIR4_9LACO|nr:TetR/AcrR family transcriptional regulator [Secundilactobacillus silagei]TDG67388.1 hypothetical protein C5L25_000984 [Secundilactobacillus silagei JCM 19001]GAX01331.1 AcrR family transcriptional regulator [Secundilactobacillus silagei JCM 19001]
MSATQHAQQIKQDSKQYLTTALFQLLATKDLNDIKVTALVKRAGVSRMAFYRNFDTLEDVILQYFGPKIQSLFNDVILQVPEKQKLGDMTEFFQTLSTELKLAVDRRYEYLIRRLFNENMVRYYDQHQVWKQLSADERHYWVAFMSAGVYAIWREWLLNDQSEPLSKIHVLIRKFQNATIDALIE